MIFVNFNYCLPATTVFSCTIIFIKYANVISFEELSSKWVDRAFNHLKCFFKDSIEPYRNFQQKIFESEYIKNVLMVMYTMLYIRIYLLPISMHHILTKVTKVLCSNLRMHPCTHILSTSIG